jgi:hypothetical protein
VKFSPVKSLVFLLGGALAATVAVVAIVALLSSGEAGEASGKCRNSSVDLESATSPGLRDAVTDPTLAQQWQRRWDEFNAQLDTGTPASATFEEGEATSRAAQWAADTNAPLEDITICLYDGIAQARARAELPVLGGLPLIGGAFETDVSIEGRINLEGVQPEITIVDIEAGDIPDWATDPLRDNVEEIVNGRLDDYEIRREYMVAYREGQIEITGAP